MSYSLNETQLSKLHNAILEAMQYCTKGRNFGNAVNWANVIINANIHEEVTKVIKSWIDRGVSTSTNSGVRYQNSVHNEGVIFPPEQIYGNLKNVANRENVINAMLTACADGIPYNKDRRSSWFTAEGLKQGLRSHSRKYADKASLSAELQETGILGKVKDVKKLVTLANTALQARRNGDRSSNLEAVKKIASLGLIAPKSISKRSNKAIGE